MRIVIAKVDEVLFDGEALSMTVPGTDGQMTIMGHHEPLISTLKPGTIVVRSQEAKPLEFLVAGGVLEVRSDGATVIL